MTLAAACENFLKYCKEEKKLSPLSIRAYRRDLDCFIACTGPTQPITAFSETWIENAVRLWLLDPQLKATTVKRRAACIKALAHWLFRRKLVSYNPLERLHLEIRTPKRLPRNLHTEEIKKLAAGTQANLHPHPQKKAPARGEWDAMTARLAIEIIALTGLRVGELVKIKHMDIDHDQHQIRIHGKGNRERCVLFPDEMTLRKISAYQEHVKNRFGGNAEGRLLHNGLGKAANEQYIRRTIRVYAQNANLERRITPHMLRHTAATQLLEAGLDIRYVQKLLGHASITTTEIYTHVADHALRQEVVRANLRERLRF